jgi:hypothetical protein
MRTAFAAGAVILFSAASLAASPAPPLRHPAPLSPDFLASAGTKAECVAQQTVAERMLGEEDADGGKTLALTDGMDQDFADEWRVLINVPKVEVRVVLAHGLESPRQRSATIIEVVEFDASGCAISRTRLSGAEWDRIVDGANRRGDAGAAI